MQRARTITSGLLATTMLAGLSANTAAQQPQQGSGKTDSAETQQPVPSNPSAADTPDTGGEIIVTATKRSESLQNVPISLTALTPAVLEQHQVASFDDYVKLLPSVSYQSFGPSQAQLYFRGIVTGSDGLASGPLPSTGLYIDETPVTTIFSSVDIHAYDLARVEALAGPQGTLYGASSLSGTLRLITNKPDSSKFEAGFNLEGNKFGSGNFGGKAEGFVNQPINDMMAVRLVGFYQKDGGYIDNTPGTRTYQRPNTASGAVDANGDPVVTNAPLTVDNAALVEKDYNDVVTYGGRAALKIDLDDSWTVTPGVIYQHQKAHGQFLFDKRNAGDLENHDFTPSGNLDKFYIASLTVQGKISDWDVTYSGSYFHRTIDNVADYSYFTVAYDASTDYNYLVDGAGADIDPTQTFHSHDRYKKMAHELRFSSPANQPLRLTAGAFAQRQVDNRVADYIIPGVRNATSPASPPVTGAPPDDVYFTGIHRVDRDYALFAEASYDLLPTVTLTGGIRGFKAKNTLDGFSGGESALNRQIALFGCTGTTVQQCPNIDKTYKESGETHKVNLTWKVDPEHLVYATYSTGFRPGGNNRDAFALGQLQSFGPFKADTLTNYELGWKTQWLDRKLRVNGAIFWEEWKDPQYSQAGLLGITYTINLDKVRSRGVEGDISWLVAKHLTLAASGTYVDAKLRSPYCDQTNGCDPAAGGAVLAPKGTRLPVTPRVKINGTARYDFDLGPNKAFLQGGANYQSNTLNNLTTGDRALLGKNKPFTTFDFSAGFKWNSLSLEAFIQNAFDRRGILSKNTVCAIQACLENARSFPIKPQFFGVRVGDRF